MDAPPPPLLVAYRLLGWRLGPEHRTWLHHDITSRGYLVRQAVPVVAVVGGLLALVFALTGSDPRAVIGPLLAVLVLLVLLRRTVVDRALRQHGLDAEGKVLPGATWVDDPAERHRRSMASATSTVALVGVGLVLLAFGPGAGTK